MIASTQTLVLVCSAFLPFVAVSVCTWDCSAWLWLWCSFCGPGSINAWKNSTHTVQEEEQITPCVIPACVSTACVIPPCVTPPYFISAFVSQPMCHTSICHNSMCRSILCVVCPSSLLCPCKDASHLAPIGTDKTGHLQQHLLLIRGCTTPSSSLSALTCSSITWLCCCSRQGTAVYKL